MRNDGSDLGVSIREALDDLDLETPDQVADVLRWYRATGERYESQSCPLARYLHLRTGDASLIVGSVLVLSGHDDGGTARDVPLPHSAQKFRRMFDGGGYLDLRVERPA